MAKTLNMMLKEIAHRPYNAALVLLTVAAVVTLLVFFQTTSRFFEDKTRIIQKDLGSNLTILPADTDLLVYHNTGIPDTTMDHAVIDKLLAQGVVSMNHLIAKLEQRIDLDGQSAVLTGIAPSQATPGRPQGKMNDGVEPGTLEMGHAIAAHLGVSRGDQVAVLGESFELALVYVEKGTAEDVRIFADLGDTQRLLNLPGQINRIEALDCVSCVNPGAQALPILRDELESVAPELQVVRAADIANARADQRVVSKRYIESVLPFVLIGSLVAIAAITMLNVRDRRDEIGTLRALGKSTCTVGLLFLAKALLLSLIGAALGAAIGSTLALSQGAAVFDLPEKKITLDWNLITTMLWLAPLLALLAAALPAVVAMTQHPADAMTEK